jgi:hypothetical protein
MKRSLIPAHGSGPRVLLFTSPAERRQADLFWADLMGAAGSATEAEDDLSEEEELRTWPILTTLSDSIVDQIVANRNRVQIRESELRLAPGGYSALGRNFAPTMICSPVEEQNPRLKELLTRLNVELAGEGRTSSVMTGVGCLRSSKRNDGRD